MLIELRVENLLLIERAELALADGLTVMTGETGAGKTVLAHALDLLLGGRARTGIVRPGASEAYVEGVFDLDDALRARLGDRLSDDADELILARRVGADGRTRAAINGRSITVGELRDIAADLVTFYGQHEHRKLTLAGAQLELLDGFCDAEHAQRRLACAAAHRRVRELEAALEALRERAGARERELDLLAFELAEIEELDPAPDEHAELLVSRERLRHLDRLRAAALGAAGALEPDEDDHGVAALVAGAAGALDGVAGVDPGLDTLAARLHSVLVELRDAAGELRAAGEGYDAEPGELERVEERLAAIDRLVRKHGGTVEAVLGHATSCRERRAELLDAEVALESSGVRLAAARDEHAELCAALHKVRVAAAKKLSTAVRARLAALAMEGASFAIEITRREPGPTGADAVEMLIAPNPGVSAAPLRETASGGELSRIMLALLCAANAQGAAALVFDEVDAGIGGLTARAVGEQLRELAGGRQVLCITHLPQIAALAERHFSIAKDSSVTPARTTVSEVTGGGVVAELVRMLGADEGDAAAKRHARELIKAT